MDSSRSVAEFVSKERNLWFIQDQSKQQNNENLNMNAKMSL